MDGHRHAVTSADGTGSASPAGAHEIIGDLDAGLTNQTLAVLDGQGHNAMDEAPDVLVTQLASLFSQAPALS